MSTIGDLFADQGGGRIPDSILRRKRPLPGDVFFAINPDADGAAKVAEITQRLYSAQGLTGVPIAPERLHVTLLRIGHYPELRQEVAEAADNAAAVVTMPPFEVMFDRARSFFVRQPKLPLVLLGGDGVAGLEMFRQALIAEMKTAGFRFRKVSQYTPHMTLLYDRHVVLEQLVEPVRWTVREFALVHSLYGHSQHILLARWPLRS